MSLALLANLHSDRIRSLPILIVHVTEGCNLACAMCSYRDRLPNELTVAEMVALAEQAAHLGLREVVFSGGEPLMRRDLPDIVAAFPHHVKRTLLTNGLLLEKRIDELASMLGEIIVSIDGATAETHDAIRGIACFDLITHGIVTVRREHPAIPLSLRCVLQKRNYRELPRIIDLARDLGVDRVSFLNVDIETNSFGREQSSESPSTSGLLLSPAEAAEFRTIVEETVRTHSVQFASRFVSETREKMMKLVRFFEAAAGGGEWPRVECNAPMVSTVVTSTGDVRPCFFLPPIGNVRRESLAAILNGPSAIAARRAVRAYTPVECQTCVCSLKMTRRHALML